MGTGRLSETNRNLIIFLVLFSIAAWLGFEWYESTSYGNFCYNIGNYLVKVLFAVFVIGVVSAIGYWLDTRRDR